MKFRALCVCLFLVGVWFTFTSYGKKDSIPSLDSLYSFSLDHPSEGSRWELLWNCQGQGPCPRLSDYPDLPVSQKWLDSISQGLTALPKYTGLPKDTGLLQYPEGKERLESPHASHALSDYTLIMHDQSGQRRRFRIGRQNPLLQSYYLFEIPSEEGLTKHDGAPRAEFYLLSEDLLQQLSVSQEEILERGIFPDFPSSELIERCVVTPVGKSPIYLEQQAGAWVINGKVADAPFVQGLFKNIKSLQFLALAPSRDNLALFLEIIIQYGIQDGKSKTELIRIFREMGSEEQYYLQPGDKTTLFHLEALPRMMSHITEEMFLR